MATEYDEDVRENRFFQKVRKKYNSIAQKGWIVCVPRRGTYAENFLTDDDLIEHILIPQNDFENNEGSCYRTLNGKDVKLTNKMVSLKNGVAEACSYLLFEETFYEQDQSKYRVWCLERPLRVQNVQLHSATDRQDVSSINLNLVTNLREAIAFLWIQTSKKRLLTELMSLIEAFIYDQSNLEKRSIQEQRDLLERLYAASLDLLLRDDRLRSLGSSNEPFHKNLKIALETYLLFSLRDTLARSLSTCTGDADGKLNKILRNLSELELRDLRVRSDLSDRVRIASVKLSRLDRFATVLEKTECLKRAVHYLWQGLPSVSSDDLLPALVFLIIRTGLPNWIAQLTFMKYFRFSVPFLHGADEASFLVSSLEAAIEYLTHNRVSSGGIEFEKYYEFPKCHTRCCHGHCCGRQRQALHRRHRSSTDTDGQEVNQVEEEKHKEQCGDENEQGEMKCQEGEETDICTKRLFKSVRVGDLSEVKTILLEDPYTDPKKDIGNITLTFCHPLCICHNCETLRRRENQSNNNIVSRWRDQNGFTTVHVAALYNRENIIQFLLSLESEAADLRDEDGRTALHWASAKGNHDSLTTLLSLNANPNLRDLRDDTPLHLAVEYGHQKCVQSLLEHVDPNPVNVNGNTPLHTASKWGFQEIVRLLLNYGANPIMDNKKGETAVTMAHNKHVLDLLTNVTKDTRVATIMSCRFLPQSVESFTSDTETTSLPRTATNADKMSEINRTERVLDKLFTAITVGDTCLACYYLGLENSRGETPSRINESCHPLCDCERCCLPISEDGKHNQPDETTIDICTEKRRKKGEVLSINTCNRAGETALHVASAAGSTDMVRILLDAGANVNARTEFEQRTPLHLACLCGNVHVIELLLNCGTCELNARDRNQDTPLHFAIKSANPKLVKFLVRHGANTQLRNVRGATPLSLLEEQVSTDAFTLPFLEISNILKRSSFENAACGV